MKIERFDLNYGWGDPIFLVEIDSLDEFPTSYVWPSKHIRVLSIMDSSAMSRDEIMAFVDRLMDHHCTVFHAAGDDSGRVHDIYDLMEIGREVIDEIPFDRCNTVWTEDEPLKEYLWHFLNTWNPSEEFRETTGTNVIVVNNDPEIVDRLRSLFADCECDWMNDVFE